MRGMTTCLLLLGGSVVEVTGSEEIVSCPQQYQKREGAPLPTHKSHGGTACLHDRNRVSGRS